MSQRQFKAVIVGGGPAGVAVLLSAHRDGKLRELLQQGLLIVERGETIGQGQIGNYAINSDSTGDTFIDPLRAGNEPSLRRLLETPVAKRCAAAGQDPVPLSDVGELMALIGEAMHALIFEHPESEVLTSASADCAEALPGGGWRVHLSNAAGKKRIVQTQQLILATGAAQPQARLEREFVAGVPVKQRWGHKLMQSGDVISVGGFAKVAELLGAKSDPKIAILGGSTSAVAVAHALLNRVPQVRFQTAGVTLYHRRPLSVYYTSPELAVSEGYTEFGPNDICPITNRVFRLAGLRLDSRELLMQVRGIGGRRPEPRMAMHLLKADDAEAVAQIDAADLVIAALGYRPNALPILDHASEPVALFSHNSPAAQLVDGHCRVLASDGSPIPGLYGIGLAAGFVPYGKFGGEPSFSGQANGLWLWQNGIGSIIVEAVLANTRAKAAEAHSTPQASFSRMVNSATALGLVALSGTAL